MSLKRRRSRLVANKPIRKKRALGPATNTTLTSTRVQGYRYQYLPIDSKSGQIRLLTIRAGSFSAPLILSLENVHQLSRATSTGCSSTLPKRVPRETFDALSYAWGSQADSPIIRLGASENNMLAITRNLFNALPYLRHPDRDRLIWIDAICIDQSNFDERALQVQLMAEIFQQAEQVVCWLGPPNDDSKLGFATIRTIMQKVDVNLEDESIQPLSWKHKQWADASEPLPFDAGIVRALSDVFGRAWFERLWIYQEIRLAGRRALMQCGDDQLDWESMVKANWCFLSKPWKERISGELRQRFGVVSRMHYPNPTNLALLIRRTIHLKCSDPRDRVYATMSTRWNEEKQIQIEVNYKKPAGKVYQDYVQHFVTQFKSLRLLAFCEIQNHSGDMPTWVPDWSHPPCTEAPRALQYASGYMQSEITSISEEALKVTGLHVATIEEKASITLGSNAAEDVIDFIRKCAPPGILGKSHPGDTTLLEAYCSTLCWDTFSERIAPNRVAFPCFTSSLEALTRVLRDSSETLTSAEVPSKYLELVAETCTGRALITTKEGYIGLAPMATEAGDYVCTILGCRSIMILRPTKTCFQVVGQAYLHGMNNGEPLFGQFPAPYQPVLRDDRGVFRDLFFRNQRTGELGRIDPRFVDWQDHELTDGLWLGRAPTTDALRARGKVLETFELI
ncbi:Nn.00g035800.m01.CDS01 [Neocucurbitaria sp. VM-36]